MHKKTTNSHRHLILIKDPTLKSNEGGFSMGDHLVSNIGDRFEVLLHVTADECKKERGWKLMFENVPQIPQPVLWSKYNAFLNEYARITTSGVGPLSTMK